MENCKADNIPEKLFRSYWKQGKLSLYKEHLYQSLSINSCSMDHEFFYQEHLFPGTPERVIYSFTYLFIYLFIYLSIYLFIYLFIYF